MPEIAETKDGIDTSVEGDFERRDEPQHALDGFGAGDLAVVSTEALEFLASRCATDLIPADREMTREGEAAGKIYIIVRGTVETPSQVLQDGDCIDDGAFTGLTKSVATWARTDCICVSLERAHVEEALKKFSIRD